MIMYAWKQFGNDFRNGDDAVFWDSNRPRDENGTKIRPGLQGDKWKWRETNKKTWFSEICLKWWSDWTSTQSWQPVAREIPVIKPKWESKKDWENAGYPYEISDSDWAHWAYSNEFYDEPQYRLVEWDFTYAFHDGYTVWTTQVPPVLKTKHTTCIEIVKDWLYFIECSALFRFNYDWSWNYDSNYAYQYKERCGLSALWPEWYFFDSNRNCQRAVWNWDNLRYINIQHCRPWDRYLPTWWFQQPNWSSGMFFMIHMVYLW